VVALANKALRKVRVQVSLLAPIPDEDDVGEEDARADPVEAAVAAVVRVLQDPQRS